MVIPAEITAKHGVSQEEVFRQGGSATRIGDAVFEFATVANDHLISARDVFKESGGEIPERAMPVFLAGVRYFGFGYAFGRTDGLDTGSGVELVGKAGEG